MELSGDGKTVRLANAEIHRAIRDYILVNLPSLSSLRRITLLPDGAVSVQIEIVPKDGRNPQTAIIKSATLPVRAVPIETAPDL